MLRTIPKPIELRAFVESAVDKNALLGFKDLVNNIMMFSAGANTVPIELQVSLHGYILLGQKSQLTYKILWLRMFWEHRNINLLYLMSTTLHHIFAQALAQRRHSLKSIVLSTKLGSSLQIETLRQPTTRLLMDPYSLSP
jgi:hypothetical protein